MPSGNSPLRARGTAPLPDGDPAARWAVLLDARRRLEGEALGTWPAAAKRSGMQGLIVAADALASAARGSANRVPEMCFAALDSERDLAVLAGSSLAGYFLGLGVALDSALVRSLARLEGRMLLTANALSCSELDAYMSWFEPDRLVLVYSHSPANPAGGDLLRTMLGLIKLQRLSPVPLALEASPIHLNLAILALAWGAAAVIWDLGAASDAVAPQVTVAQVHAATARLRDAERFYQSPELVEMGPDDWDAVEGEMASLVAARPLRRGEVLTADMLRAAPPYRGVAVTLLPRLLGCRLRYDLAAGENLTFGMLDLPEPRNS